MLVYILSGIAAVVLAFVAFVALQPSQFRIVRQALMSAPAAAVFDRVNDLHNWEDWSPWAKLDPGMKLTYSGPQSGTGAGYAWAGNNKVGEGRMTILESQPSEYVRIKLEFLRPWTATNTTEFRFEPRGQQTEVTWDMTGTNNFMAKAFGLFMNMDKLIGADFEKGLAQMKSLVESTAR